MLAVLNWFSGYIEARALADERAEALPRTLIQKRILILGSTEALLSDETRILVDNVILSPADVPGSARMQPNAFHPPANVTVQSWNRAVRRGPACLTGTKPKKTLSSYIRAFKVKATPGRAGCLLESDAGDKRVRAHANRLPCNGRDVSGTEKALDGAVSDSLRTLERISDVTRRRNAHNRNKERRFRAQHPGRRFSR